MLYFYRPKIKKYKILDKNNAICEEGTNYPFNALYYLSMSTLQNTTLPFCRSYIIKIFLKDNITVEWLFSSKEERDEEADRLSNWLCSKQKK